MQYGEDTLYFHFYTPRGLPASLPMKKEILTTRAAFEGVPGTQRTALGLYLVPGYRCINCSKLYFAADAEGLRHECMNNAGVISTDGRSAAGGD